MEKYPFISSYDATGNVKKILQDRFNKTISITKQKKNLKLMIFYMKLIMHWMIMKYKLHIYWYT